MNYAGDVRETARVIYASRSSQIQLLQDAPAAFKELGRQQLTSKSFLRIPTLAQRHARCVAHMHPVRQPAPSPYYTLTTDRI